MTEIDEKNYVFILYQRAWSLNTILGVFLTEELGRDALASYPENDEIEYVLEQQRANELFTRFNVIVLASK